MNKQIKSVTLAASLVVGVVAGLTAPPAAGQVQAFTAFPSADPADGRMLSLANGFESLTGQQVVLSLAVPPDDASFRFQIFDGDTGRACRASDPCTLPAAGHWDDGSAQLIVSMYFDPQFDPIDPEPVSNLTLVGRWFGNQVNPTVDVNGRWTADAEMLDNDFWDLDVTVTPESRAPSGVGFYRVVIELDPSDPTESASSFKLYSTVPIALLSADFGFIGALQQVQNDGRIVYPRWDGSFPSLGSNFWQQEVGSGGSTFDGRWRVFLNVPPGQLALRIFDGDFDFGTRGTVGLPSQLPIAACADTDDPDSFGVPDFATVTADLRDEAAQPYGIPADDNVLDVFRRQGCVTYKVTDPLGNVYVNDNPSGDKEWEQFAIATVSSGLPADFTVDANQIPSGLWKIEVAGLDMSNLNFWHFDFVACGQVGGIPFCPPQETTPYLIGDTVFLDEDADGVQDPGEPGIPGILLEIIDSTGGVAGHATTDENGIYHFGVLAGDWTVNVAPTNFLPQTSGAVGDRVWLDLNGNGAQDAGEPGLSTVTVRLLDAATNASLGTRLTDRNGNYLFDGLPPGSYRVDVLDETVPAGLTLSGGADPSNPVTITANEVFLDLDFGYTDGVLGILGDYVWSDADDDGIQDDGEPGIGNVVLNLFELGGDMQVGGGDDTLVAQTLTQGDGSYLFTELPAGTYAIEVDAGNFSGVGVLFGKTVTAGPQSEGADTSAPVTLATGEVVLTVDFGYVEPGLLSIADTVWFDADSDGVFDGGESPIPGVTVSLVNGDLQVAATTTTDAAGRFRFVGLESGAYQLVITDVFRQLDGLHGTTVPGIDRSLIVLLNDVDIDEINFGYVNGGALTGYTSTTGDTLSFPVIDENVLTFDFGYVPPGSCEVGRPMALTFLYTGDSCSHPNASNNLQGGLPGTSGDYECSGPLDGNEPVQLVAAKKANRFAISPSTETILVGDLVVVSGTNGRPLFPTADLALEQGGVRVQSIALHTSCSQPLAVGDQFGSLRVVGFQN